MGSIPRLETQGSQTGGVGVASSLQGVSEPWLCQWARACQEGGGLFSKPLHENVNRDWWGPCSQHPGCREVKGSSPVVGVLLNSRLDNRLWAGSGAPQGLGKPQVRRMEPLTLAEPCKPWTILPPKSRAGRRGGPPKSGTSLACLEPGWQACGLWVSVTQRVSAPVTLPRMPGQTGMSAR